MATSDHIYPRNEFRWFHWADNYLGGEFSGVSFSIDKRRSDDGSWEFWCEASEWIPFEERPHLADEPMPTLKKRVEHMVTEQIKENLQHIGAL